MATRRQWVRRAILAVFVAILVLPLATPARGEVGQVALAFVWRGSVTLADSDGNPITQPGPAFTYGQGARLFWTPDAQTLYVARDDALYVATPSDAPAVKVPGYYGRTLTIAQDAQTLYYLETVSPQATKDANDQERVSYPLRELEMMSMDGGAGRMSGYFGLFQPGASQAAVTFAGVLYARDGGLLGPGRPNVWPTYGTNLFGTCCFPAPGLGLYEVQTGNFTVYDAAFIPGGAATNLTRTHLAGPTVNGAIRVIDLITGGTRDYVIAIAGGLGTIERVAWSPDDTYLYFISRYAPTTPLALDKEPSFPVDVSSADITLYRLDLVTSVVRELAWRSDVYGVSSLAATADYVFATVVDPNTALVADLNARRVRPGALPTDSDMAQYMPATHLWRVDAAGGGAQDVLDDVWGLASRPIR